MKGELKFELDGINFDFTDDPQQTRLARFVKDINAIVSLPHQRRQHVFGYQSDLKLLSKELTLTALISRALDRFLISDENVSLGACFHQIPITAHGSSVDRPDIYVLTLESGKPVDAIALGDIKVKDDKASLHETIAYVVKAANMYKDSRVIIGISITLKSLTLLVCQETGRKKVQIIKALNEVSYNNLKEFACMLYASIHYLIEYPIFSSFYPISVKCKMGGTHKALNNSRRVVKCSTGKVHKFYDHDEYDANDVVSNFELIQKFNLLPEVELIELSSDGRFEQMDYKYIEAVDATPEHVVLLVRKLALLHQNNVVHMQ